VTTTPPRKPPPQPGQTWTVGESLVSLLADTPVTVTAVLGGVGCNFTTASGLPVRLPVSVFRMLYQPADQAPPA
jgi:hypothetical protein